MSIMDNAVESVQGSNGLPNQSIYPIYPTFFICNICSLKALHIDRERGQKWKPGIKKIEKDGKTVKKCVQN